MDSPALRGFDQFLRYRPGESRPELPQTKPDQSKESPIGELPIGNSQADPQPEGRPARRGQLPIGDSPTGVTPIGALPEGSTPQIPAFSPPPKVHRAVRAQDGHSSGEQALYQALWNAATP